MEKLLQQSQIDALFAGASQSFPQAPGPAAPDAHQLFNFGRAGQISDDQMRAISTVNDLFARNLRHTVGAWLRTEFHVALVSGEQMMFSEFVERVAEKTYMASVRLEPLGAIGLVELELAITAPIVDLLLGGTGQAQPLRILTDIEELIMASVAQMIVRELNTAWQSVGLVFNFEKQESTESIERIMAASEKTLCVSFEVQMPAASGVLNLCLPAVVLNTILRHLTTVRARPRVHHPEIALRVRELVSAARVGAVLQFPPVRLHAREIGTLAPGTVLRLPVPRHAVAELRVAGLALGAARPVRMGEHRGARLEPLLPETVSETSEPVH